MNQFSCLVECIDPATAASNTDLRITAMRSEQTQFQGGPTSSFVFDKHHRIVEHVAIQQHVPPAQRRDPNWRRAEHPVKQVDMVTILFQDRPPGQIFAGPPAKPHRPAKLTTPHQV